MKQLKQHILIASVLLLLTSSCVEHIAAPTSEKMVIYQVFTRLFGSDNEHTIYNGELSTNGVGKFDDFTTTALDSIKAMGMTHIWYTGVIEHASIYSIDTVGGIQKNHPSMIKGKAGSPYAIKDYYDVNAYLANNVADRMGEFEALVARSHQAGLGVIIDFVPNHVARGYHSDAAPKGVADFGDNDDTTVAFCANNNFYYLPNEPLRPQFDTQYHGIAYEEFPARVTGNDVFSAQPEIGDWYETIKLNYGVDYLNNRENHFDPIPDTWLKMKDILLYWASKGVDGFRCDMAEMVPVEFWEWVIEEVNREYPRLVFIAEIYNPDAYDSYITQGGFDYLYDKVGLYDTLKYVVQGKSTTLAISQSREKIARVQSHMLNFLENHDEQRIAWREFAGSAQAGIPMMAISTLCDNIPMMVYFGQEIGEVATDSTGFSGADGRTSIFDFTTLHRYQAWRNGGVFDGARLTPQERELRNDYIAILKLANSEPLFLDGAFTDLTANNPTASRAIYAFARNDSKRVALVLANLSDSRCSAHYQLPTAWGEINFDTTLFDSDSGANNVLLSSETRCIDVLLNPYQAMVVVGEIE